MHPSENHPRRKLAPIGAVATLSFLVVACGGGDDSDSDSAGLVPGDDTTEFGLGDDQESDELADALNPTGGSGGGGTLVFDGVDYPIESAVCALDSQRVDIGTVGGGYRVLVSGDPSDLSLQILGPETLWFDGGSAADAPPSGQATIDGNTITAAENIWRNNNDDREVTASFVIECP